VTNIEDTSVSVIDGAANGQHTSGCSCTPPKIAVGDYPGSIAVDPKAGTAYLSTPRGRLGHPPHPLTRNQMVVPELPAKPIFRLRGGLQHQDR
jgi:hypothetical protein